VRSFSFPSSFLPGELRVHARYLSHWVDRTRLREVQVCHGVEKN
jgi:hypothetical protein